VNDGSTPNNIAFHRDSFAFVTRGMSDSSSMPGGNNIRTMTDPVTGLSMRLEVVRQNKQWVWDFDVLYGGCVLRQGWGCRLMDS
jgi:hypothetical protein